MYVYNVKHYYHHTLLLSLTLNVFYFLFVLWVFFQKTNNHHVLL